MTFPHLTFSLPLITRGSIFFPTSQEGEEWASQLAMKSLITRPRGSLSLRWGMAYLGNHMGIGLQGVLLFVCAQVGSVWTGIVWHSTDDQHMRQFAPGELPCYGNHWAKVLGLFICVNFNCSKDVGENVPTNAYLPKRIKNPTSAPLIDSESFIT